MRRIPLGKAYYEVDDENKTFRYISRNKHWKLMTHKTNERNRESIDGYYRINKDGTKKRFRNKR